MQTSFIQENPNAELLNKTFSVELQPPYSLVYKNATVRYRQKLGQALIRRHISFTGKADGQETYCGERLPIGTTYARYLMNCYLWKTEGRLLTDEEEVDHVNGNALDDRLDNFEIVTSQENIRRRDYMKYASYGISQDVIDKLSDLLRAGENRRYIAMEMGITMGYLRYLIDTYFPEYGVDVGVMRDLDDIIKRRKEGESCRSIADSYGVDSATVQRFIIAHCPDLSGAALREERTAYIIDQAKKGVHYNDIAKVIGCTPVNVWYYIKTKLPEIAKQYKEKSGARSESVQERNRKIITMIAPFVNVGVTYGELESALGARRGRLQEIVSKYDKEKRVQPLYRNRPKSQCPSIEDTIEKYPELKGTLQKIDM